MAERDGLDASEALRAAASAAVVGAAVGAARAFAGRRDAPEPEPEDTSDVHDEQHEERDEPAEHDDEHDDEPEQRRDEPSSSEARPANGNVVDSARRHLRELRGEEAESVSSLTPTAGGWRVGLEVVEVHRVPETTDVLASYDIEVDDDGRLLRFERSGRYYRSQAERGDR